MMVMPRVKGEAASQWNGLDQDLPAKKERAGLATQVDDALSPAKEAAVKKDATQLQLENDELKLALEIKESERKSALATVLEKEEELKKRDLQITELRRRLSRGAEDEAGFAWEE